MAKEKAQGQDKRKQEDIRINVENINKQQWLKRRIKYRRDRYDDIIGEVENET